MTEHPDCTYCPQCHECIPVCRWDGKRLVTMCHGLEPIHAQGRSTTACDDQHAPEPTDA